MNTAAASEAAITLVVFLLDGGRYAVEVTRVWRVEQMVALTPFPKAPEIVAGVVDYRGRLVPVMNVRRRFGLRERPPTSGDQLLLLHARRRVVAFAVDAVEPARTVPATEVAAPERVVPGLELVRGIVRLPDEGLVFVHDLDSFLSLEEDRLVGVALEQARP